MLVGESDTNKILDFLRLARRMETTYRFTPKPDGSFENDAEHSWSVSLICILVASRIEEELGVKIDQLKMLKMAIIHDIAEIVTGDTKTWDNVSRVDKEEKERTAIKDSLGRLPNDLMEELVNIWEECEKRESIEAMIVKSVDRFDPVIHRTVFDLGWDNVEDDHATSEALDERQLPRHSFSKTLTGLYTTIRDEAISKGMFKVAKPQSDTDVEDELDQERADSEGMIQKEWIDEELMNELAEDLHNGSTPG
ncbi:MAG: HD superfamily metal-dependent phosphohydrolase [Candidatus Collierbacteria bacterium GW2011_GWB1_45_35]|uniref:5'-deoxynucleotidase n=2 Tax=Candidatus Collieribacteriota TaxID=1752725 RepID=A0A837IQI0_9BACT|nr:MAG: HD superfamily metal-dependent phosphohydrolase [Microgenomates group bacterium GW2011_GWC1_44_23]KKT96224.1 MAG: HD superfamily metal-dependent phosphohydrolase [Candidatus Collierbacteria bacterium GW2011_GWA1_45_15]KKU01264.1 MAG: HD superfamily metal-dependent phosphohydrolase [Candidatus Collierbacteria bacterium GW2011_GWB2_45_17]KKU05308.1 MAG: HD superfamily metal-dependent phosphohydrolase [Candidatus Collierbacteria bacterium GW2011_GWB1_45_35]KKU06694.1 MAG: HD superfamily me